MKRWYLYALLVVQQLVFIGVVVYLRLNSSAPVQKESLVASGTNFVSAVQAISREHEDCHKNHETANAAMSEGVNAFRKRLQQQVVELIEENAKLREQLRTASAGGGNLKKKKMMRDETK